MLPVLLYLYLVRARGRVEQDVVFGALRVSIFTRSCTGAVLWESDRPSRVHRHSTIRHGAARDGRDA